jgi:hypothetical protein
MMTETVEQRGERVEELSFEAYRQKCDEASPSFRKIGLLETIGYSQALRDPETITTIVDGRRVPLLAPIKYASGYDIDRVPVLTDAAKNYLLAMPVQTLGGNEQLIREQLSRQQTAILIESDHRYKESDVEAAAQFFGQGLEPREFLDPRVPAETAPASMSIYQVGFESQASDGSVNAVEGDLMSAFARELQASVEADGPVDTLLLDSRQLLEHEELIDQLWEICQNRFEWLGDHHPVSMEETKDFFTHVVVDEGTFTAVRFEDEKPIAFGFFIEGLEQCSWLKNEFCDQITREAAQRDEKLIYFHGIASMSTPKKTGHYAKDIVQLLARVCQRRGGTYRYLFESTNLSSLYIPGMVERYVDSSRALTRVTPAEKIAQQDYWMLKA